MTITLVALTHSELEWPKNFSHGLPLNTYGLIGFESLSRSSRKLQPLMSDTWKDIFQLLRIESHSLFLLKSHNNLYRKTEEKLKYLVSLSTISWRGYLQLLRQSQNSMELLLPFWKNFPSFPNIAADCTWYG